MIALFVRRVKRHVCCASSGPSRYCPIVPAPISQASSAHHGTTSFVVCGRLSASCCPSTPRCRWIPPGVPSNEIAHQKRSMPLPAATRGNPNAALVPALPRLAASAVTATISPRRQKPYPSTNRHCLSQPQPRCRIKLLAALSETLETGARSAISPERRVELSQNRVVF
jgi:hypothetical protein